MAKVALGTLRNTVMAIGVCASLAAGSFGFSGSAEARVPASDPRADSLAAGCGALQDEADALRAEYKAVASANPGSARLDEILARLRVIGGQWNDICRGTFGNMAYLVRPDRLSDIQAAPVTEVSLASDGGSTMPLKTWNLKGSSRFDR